MFEKIKQFVRELSPRHIESHNEAKLQEFSTARREILKEIDKHLS